MKKYKLIYINLTVPFAYHNCLDTQELNGLFDSLETAKNELTIQINSGKKGIYIISEHDNYNDGEIIYTSSLGV